MRASQDDVRRSNRLCGKQEDRRIEAAELHEHTEPSRERTAPTRMSEDLTLLESAGQLPATCTHFQQQDSFMGAVRTGYKDDPVLAKLVAEKPRHHPTFSMDGGLIHVMNSGGERVLCVPQMQWKGDSMTTCIIDHMHKVLGHLGALRTADYICRWYWSPGLSKEVG